MLKYISKITVLSILMFALLLAIYVIAALTLRPVNQFPVLVGLDVALIVVIAIVASFSIVPKKGAQR